MQLIVDGEPLLLLAGESGNSSASSLDTLAALRPKLTRLNLNTVRAPVYWELVEPVDGLFDFELVDGLVRQARAAGMRLVLLWFGSWKNSLSSYAPSWVKRDQERFPRAVRKDGPGLEMLTPFSEANVAADARAFAALLQHLRAIDGETRTVVMVQVENEIGMIPDARDHGEAVNAAFAGDVVSSRPGIPPAPSRRVLQSGPARRFFRQPARRPARTRRAHHTDNRRASSCVARFCFSMSCRPRCGPAAIWCSPPRSCHGCSAKDPSPNC